MTYMKDVMLLKLMKENYGITFSDNPSYYIDRTIKPRKEIFLSPTPTHNKCSKTVYSEDKEISSYPNLQQNSYYRECNLDNYKSTMFRTTFSMKIGDKESSIEKVADGKLMHSLIKESKLENDIFKQVDESHLETTEDDTELSNELEQSHFKSSYAKLLADSYHHSSPSDSIYLTQICAENQTMEKDASKENQCIDPNKYEEILQQMLTLNAKLTKSEDDLTDAQKEILTLKLECARMKAENRSMKAAVSVVNSPVKYKQTDYLPIASSHEDMWTLQQKVINLTNQLKKAELTKHAYESATAQLVMFLKTLTTTLTPLANEERLSEYSNASHTASMLTDIENTLKSNNKLNYNRERSFVRMNNLKNSLHRPDISHGKASHQKVNVKNHKASHSFTSNSSSGNSLRKDLRKIVKKKTKVKLRKCESFSDLPSSQNRPRVTRTLSAEDVCENEKFENTNSSHLSSLKNKGFFSSLRNVFKIEGEKAVETCKKPKKKRKGFLSFSKRSKRVPSPTRSNEGPPSIQSSTFYINYPSSEEGSTVVETELDSLPVCVEAESPQPFDQPDTTQLPPELLSGPTELSVNLSMMNINVAEITPSGYGQVNALSLPWEPLSDNISRGRTHCMQGLWRKSRSSFREADTRLCFV